MTTAAPMLLAAALVGAPNATNPDANTARGARVPWTRYEAEDGRLTGAAVVEGPSRSRGTFAAESSGRRCVRLDGPGAGVSFTLRAPARAVVVRLSIPDAPGGGGRDGVLTLTAGGVAHALPVTSRFAWQYGDEAANKGEFINDPPEPGYLGPLARMRFDEVRFVLPAEVPAGSTLDLALATAPASNIEWAYVDLVEAEPLPDPVPRPAGALAVTDPAFGATPDDATDDLAAFRACIDRARAEGRVAFIPPGTYRLSGPVTMPEQGVLVQGAGMWHTRVLFTIDGTRTPARTGLHGRGGAVRVSDLSLAGTTTRRDQTRGFSGWFGPGSEIRRVWVEHFGVGAWVADYDPPRDDVTDRLLIADSRFRNLYADGVNFCLGTRDSTVENCHVRNTMDDGLATWSARRNAIPATRGNAFRANTVELTLRAAGIGVFGGGGHTVERNVVADTLVDGGIRFSTTFPGHPFDDRATTRALANDLVRCGGTSYGRRMGAVVLVADEAMGPLRNVRFADNRILDPTDHGVLVVNYGRAPHEVRDVSFERTEIRGAGASGFTAYDGVRGWIEESGSIIALDDPAAPPRRAGPGFEIRTTTTPGPRDGSRDTR